MYINLINMSQQIGINFLVAFLCLVFGYLCGSFPTAIIIGKVFFKQDPRDYGSGNAGGTNAGRIWGKKIGLIVILIDMFKLIAPLYISWAILTFVKIGDKPLLVSTLDSYNTTICQTYVIQWPVYYIASIGCIIGHCYPIWCSFKGGKGAASFMGFAVASSWLMSIIPAITFFVVLKKKKYVSLSVLITASLFTLIAWIVAIINLTNLVPPEWRSFFMYGGSLKADYVFAITSTILLAFVYIKHIENIKRLLSGNERKIKWMK